MRIFIGMLRTILLVAVLMSGMAVKAQTDSSFGAMGFHHFQRGNDTSHILPKKWFVTRYTGVSTGLMAFKGGSTSFFSVPLALQVNRQLTNTLYAFGNVSLTPYVFHYNSMPSSPAVNKYNNFMQTNNFAAYSDAKVGLMYVNPDKTFSISGSIGVGRGSYNGYAPFYAPMYMPAQGHMQR